VEYIKKKEYMGVTVWGVGFKVTSSPHISQVAEEDCESKQSVSVGEVINSSILSEMLDDVDRIVIAVVIDLDVSGIPHSLHVPEGSTDFGIRYR